jgi:hypothetical protein
MESSKRCFQKSLHKGSDLDSVIEFLENTSKIQFFRDPRPIVSMSDGRIHEIKQVLIWFQSWRDEVSMLESLTAKQKEKMLLSSKCIDDIYPILQLGTIGPKLLPYHF